MEPPIVDPTEPTIQVKVGAEERVIYVHDSLISKRCKFSRGSCNRVSHEGATKIVSLPREEPDMVTAYVQWLYSRKFPVEMYFDDGEPSFRDLVRLCILGENIDDENFQNAVLDRIIELADERVPATNSHSTWLDHGVINTIYWEAQPESPLRRLFVDIAVARMGADWAEALVDGRWGVDEAFKDDMVKALLTIKNNPTDDTRDLFKGADRCQYHTHGPEGRC